MLHKQKGNKERTGYGQGEIFPDKMSSAPIGAEAGKKLLRLRILFLFIFILYCLISFLAFRM